MTTQHKILLDPSPRASSDIFSKDRYKELTDCFDVYERGDQNAVDFYRQHLSEAQFIIGQPALSTQDIDRATHLQGIINVEGNFLQNMDYQACFRRNIHVLTISPVFAQPVAELALGLALALARDIPNAHQAFVDGKELYGLGGNQQARTLKGCNLGFVGFGDLGRAILQTFAGLSPKVRIYDPWLSTEVLAREGLSSCSFHEVLSHSDVVCVVATVTDQTVGMMGEAEFQMMPSGALLLLLSRAEVVDLDAMMAACTSGHIRAATDVFPSEPMPLSHPIRKTPNLILSAHRAGALDSALLEIGDRAVADLQLMSKGLPPQNCKRAEPELVGHLQSKPVVKS
ncbi:MAG: phosphoglycerate dehydrogenase-like enzyme [Pseudomonadales bacterium]|jgi:phosphoglycerate dehydrogenase-like enzyme